jgi:hypothetical protein
MTQRRVLTFGLALASLSLTVPAQTLAAPRR